MGLNYVVRTSASLSTGQSGAPDQQWLYILKPRHCVYFSKKIKSNRIDTVTYTYHTPDHSPCSKPLGNCKLPEHLNLTELHCYCNNSYDCSIADQGLTSGQPQKPAWSDCGCLWLWGTFSFAALPSCRMIYSHSQQVTRVYMTAILTSIT